MTDYPNSPQPDTGRAASALPTQAVSAMPTPPEPAMPAPATKAFPYTILAVCTLIVSVLFWRWSVWGGFRLGHMLVFTLLLVLVTAFAIRKTAVEGRVFRTDWLTAVAGLSAEVLAVSFSLFDDALLHVIVFFAQVFLMAVYCLGLYRAAKYDPATPAMLKDVVRIVLLLPLGNMGRSLKELFLPKGGKNRTLLSVLVGIGAAIPVLLIATPLLMKGDAAFEGLMKEIAKQLAEIAGQFILGILLFFPLFSLFHALSCGEAPKRTAIPPLPQAPAPLPTAELTGFANLSPSAAANTDQTAQAVSASVPPALSPAQPLSKRAQAFKGIPVAVSAAFLGSLSFLYAVYLFTQLAYFTNAFSGLLPADFTVAEYARRGFFELCAIAFINFLLVSVVAAATRKTEAGRVPKAVTALSTFLCAFTILLIASAEAKMFLYMGSFGLTRMRLFVTAFILLLALAFLFLTIRLYATKFAYMKALVAAGCAVLLVVSYADIDRTVLRYNIGAYYEGRLETIDIDAFKELGDAKIPYLIDLTYDKTLDPQIREEAVYSLADYWRTHADRLLRLAEPLGFSSVLEMESVHLIRPTLRAWNYTERLAIDSLEDWLNDPNCPAHEFQCPSCKSYIHITHSEEEQMIYWNRDFVHKEKCPLQGVQIGSNH
ncbi:MAG: DUF4173 domain-containing protein [Oscillospiraceae bacterium]|jgi:hypothetical protein|nr:DUF4173 domain-containing protein [Oscillospiraceae bacterium]